MCNIAATVLPNSPEALAPLIADGRIPKRRVWGMLALRSILSFGLLLLMAIAYQLAGSDSAFANSAAWWLWFITAANIVCVALFIRFSRLEGMRLRDIYNANRSSWKGDLLWAMIALLGAAVLAQPPGTLLAGAFWGGMTVPNEMLFGPLPLLAVYPLFIVFPISHALAELPTYWGYVSPRLRAGGMNRWLVILIVAAALSVQHLFMSFQRDWQYSLWLAVKFFPFALWTGIILNHRPTALPYMMVGHGILDAILPVFVLTVSQGIPLG